MSDDKTELPMIPSRISFIVGGERHEALVEDVSLVPGGARFDRLHLKLVCPDRLDRTAVVKLAKAFQESAIAKPTMGPVDEVIRIDVPAQAKEVFGGEKPIEHEDDSGKLDEAIAHARQVETMLCDDNPGCAEEHKNLAMWLEELRDRREQAPHARRRITELSNAISEVKRKHREFRRVAAVSRDENVHIRLEISQRGKSWMHAFEISEMAFEMFSGSKADLLLDSGTNLLRETIGGFLVESERRSFEP